MLSSWLKIPAVSLLVLSIFTTASCAKDSPKNEKAPAAVVEANEEGTIKTKLGNHTISKTTQLRTHSIFAPYIDQDLQNRWWDFGQDAYVNTNKHIRLTRKAAGQNGWLWSRLPLTSTSFIIDVEFKVSGDSTHLFGDGMAIWLSTTRAQTGPVFGSPNAFTGLGIFLDTYANSKHSYQFPRIMGMLGDGKVEYNVGTDGDKQSIGDCSANFRRTNVATKLRIGYIKGQILDVKMQYKAWDEWTPCFTVRGITLPPSPFLGFSAMTGDVSDAHDVISVATYSAITIAPTDVPGAKPRRGSSGSSFFGVLFKLILLGGVVAGGWYGYQEYLKRKGMGGMPSYGGGGRTPIYNQSFGNQGFGSQGGFGNQGGYGYGGGYGEKRG